MMPLYRAGRPGMLQHNSKRNAAAADPCPAIPLARRQSGDDTITVTDALLNATINLGGGSGTLTLGGLGNTAIISNAKTIAAVAGADIVTLGSTLTGVTLDLGRADSLTLANVVNTG
jgi:hypothetical protein